MNKFHIYLVVFLIFLIGCILLYYYIFNIYEVTFSVVPENLFADNQSEITITTIPLNALSKKVPFRNAYTTYNIPEGKELVEVVSENKKAGILVLRAKGKPGKVVVFAKAEYAILPSSFEINIYPNLAGNVYDSGNKL